MNPNETPDDAVIMHKSISRREAEMIYPVPKPRRRIGAMLSVTGLLVAGIGNTAMSPEEMGKEGVEKIETAGLNRKQRRARKAKKRRKGGR